ncbi:MAG TPA: glutamine amidotransferase [Candidatus Omnitrophota bacterium]|nr:glutamine amidotransferase [Candidatus Omnitrophota bacterium]
MQPMKILYAGDGGEGGPANYLLGILTSLKADYLHIPPSVKMNPELLKKTFDAIILSDYSRSLMPQECQEIVTEKVLKGAGLLMIGGWASFSGPFGGWRNSIIEGLLPVGCSDRDDRVSLPGGALIRVHTPHPMFDSFTFSHSPVLCGLNEVTVRKNSHTLLTARKIQQERAPDGAVTLALDSKDYPLLVIDESNHKRTAAFTTDVAPHWCGGLIDWGSERQSIAINPKIRIEAGNLYIQFFSLLLRWLTRQ